MYKPFDIKAALSGEPVVDSLGNVYKFYSYTLYDDGSHRIKFTDPKGNFVGADLDGHILLSDDSLRMAPKKVKKLLYINVNQYKNGPDAGLFSAIAYTDERTAKTTEPSDWLELRLRTAVPVEVEVEE